MLVDARLLVMPTGSWLSVPTALQRPTLEPAEWQRLGLLEAGRASSAPAPLATMAR